jgi:hypothetical protein
LHEEDDDDDEFILADTEDDSDGSIDLELGQADYWKCVKCNNKQNNPLYRYCEKCYQVSLDEQKMPSTTINEILKMQSQ